MIRSKERVSALHYHHEHLLTAVPGQNGQGEIECVFLPTPVSSNLTQSCH